MVVPLAFGMLPGALEFFVILLISLLFICIVVAVWRFLTWMTGDTNDERVAELESEVRELNQRLDERDET